MLSSEEKINELRGIISEQENKINFFDVMLKKLMLLQKMETTKDLYNKINELQKEKEIYKNQVNELNDNISELKEELEDVKNNKIEMIMKYFMNNLENIIRNTSIQIQKMNYLKFINTRMIIIRILILT